MKVIILAAGQGKRLFPLTKNQPKCMVKYRGKRIIDYILEVVKYSNIRDISIVAGYKSEVLEKYINDNNIKFYRNEDSQKTNMVYSLFCAEDEMDDDVIISYGDVIYKKEIFEKLLYSKGEFVVVVDENWKKLWEIRMENPLSGAETMKIDPDGYIKEIGKIPRSYDDIDAQYIGLIKVSKNAILKIRGYYRSLKQNKKYSSKNYLNMDMTSFIQLIIDEVMPVKSEKIRGGWIEIDTMEDLRRYEQSDSIDLGI